MELDGEVQKVTLVEGNGIILRSGVVHAVRTLEDSFAFGINFIHHEDLRKSEKLSNNTNLILNRYLIESSVM